MSSLQLAALKEAHLMETIHLIPTKDEKHTHVTARHMPTKRFTPSVKAVLAHADIALNGNRPWDIQFKDPRLYSAVKKNALVGLGDAYIDGWWECEALDEMFCRLLQIGAQHVFRNHPRVILRALGALVFNQQMPRAAARYIHAHYDLGYELFSRTLDQRMVYSCAYWDNAKTLDEAQEAKLDLVCKKLQLERGMTVLDIGCGWGSWVRFAAEHYGVRAVGITLSSDQAEFARTNCKGLDIEIRIQDYRTVRETFDRIASIGMFEHVGPKNYRAFFDIAHSTLRDDGLFLLHTFATRDPFPNRSHCEVDWINKHIFPGLVVPSMGQIGRAVDRRFVIEDVHNFGADYDATLLAWAENVERHWTQLRDKYDERFHRMWRYYLLTCAGAFRSRAYQVWQMVLSKNGVIGGYQSQR